MADTALFLTWDKTVPGREAAGLAVFDRAIRLYEQLVSAGVLESYELGFPEPHGRPLSAFALLRGTASSISQVQQSEEFRALLTSAYLVVQGLSVTRAVIGEGVDAYLARYGDALDAVTTEGGH